MTPLPLLLLAASLFAAVKDPVPVPLPGDPLQVTVHKLDNGLTVYLSPNRELPRVSAWIAVRAGSTSDPAEATGLAHYLEHMLFKGSGRLGTTDYAKEKPHLARIEALYEAHYKAKDPKERERLYKEIDEENKKAARYAVPNELDQVYNILGFQGVNAFTSNERTVYLSDFPSNRAEAWARVEAERMMNLVPRLFQSELEAVYEEKNRSLDHPESALGEALELKLFPKHPYGTQTTIGTVEHLKNPSLSRIHAYHRAYYRPDNMAIALAGDFDRAEMLALVKRRFGSWRPRPAPPKKAWPLPTPKGREVVEVRFEAEEKVLVAWPTVGVGHPDADALTILDMLMDNSAAGIINLTLNQAQRVKAAGSSPRFHNESGYWRMWAVPKLGQTLEEAEALLMEALERLKNGEFTEDDMRAVITDFEIGEKSRLEHNGSRVALMAAAFTNLLSWPEVAGRLDRYRRVTKADVLRVARKYLGEGRVVAFRRQGKPELPSIPKPKFTKIELDPKRRSAFAAEILALPAVPPEPRWVVEGRDFLRKDIPQGRLVAGPNPFNDLFVLQFRFDRGSRRERTLCLALDLLELAGAGELSAEDYKRRLYALGTTVSYSCGERESRVTVSGLDGRLWESLELMRRRFEEPNLSTDTLKKLVVVVKGAREDNKKNPGFVHSALGELARRGEKSSFLNDLSNRELETVGESQLVKLMKGYWDYERKVAYVGNRPLGELAKLLEEPGVRYKKAPKPLPRLIDPVKSPRVLLAHREMAQARVGMFAPDGPVEPSRAVDEAFLSSYLDGGMSSVIFQEVREARALAYAAGGGYNPGDKLGDHSQLYGSVGCQADKTVEAAELMARLLREPPWSEDRFKEAAKSIEASYRTDPITFRGVPWAVHYWEGLGFAQDPRPERFKRALAYRLEDLKAYAARFKDRSLAFYILGPKDKLDLEGLKRLGPLEEKGPKDLFPY